MRKILLICFFVLGFCQIPFRSEASAYYSGNNFFSVNVYPNPVTDNFSVAFGLQKNAKVNISVYDLLGNKVLSLLDENLSGGSYNYAYTLDGKLHRGVYFIRLNAEGDSLVKKIIIN